MFKTSEQLLKIAVEKYEKTNNSEVELEYSGIVGIDRNIEDVLDDLITVIQNNQQNDIKQLRNLISDFLNTQNVNNDDLKDEL